MALMIQHDRDLAGTVSLNFTPGGTPKFQFPPICTADSKNTDWMEIDSWSNERTSINKGANGRKLGIEATYIIDGDWTANTIIEQIRTIKAFCYLGPQIRARYVTVNFYEISGGAGTYRMTEANVKYEGPIIGKGNDALPMISRITMELTFYSQLQGKQQIAGLVQDAASNRKWY